MKKVNTIWSVWNYVEAALLVLAGILCLVKAESDKFQTAVGAIVGAFIILDGLLRLTLSALGKKETRTSFLLIGSFEISIGLFVAIKFISFISLLSTFIGILLIVLGSSLILLSVYMIVRKIEKVVVPVLQIVVSAILIALGITVLCILTGPDSTEITVRILGIGLIVVSIVIAVITTIVLIKANKTNRSVIDVHNEPILKKEEKVVDAKVEDKKAVEEKKAE